MDRSTHIFKSVMYAYLITIIGVLVYNAILTFTDLSGDTMILAMSIISTVAAAFSGFYASMKIKEKGLLYGLSVGFIYIACLVLISYLAKDHFMLTLNTIYKVLLVSVAGGIGGVLGVNFK